MASSTYPADTASLDTPAHRSEFLESMRQILSIAASLKITVALFALSIGLIFFGTLAQVDKDIWQVVHEYFRSPIAWIRLQIFFPPSFFPSAPQIPGAFPYPGGWTLGGLLFINLVSAHLIRFRIQARDTRLVAGLAGMGIGLLMTALVVQSGSNVDGLLGESLVSWNTLWKLFLLWLAAGFLALVYGVARPNASSMGQRIVCAVLACLAGTALGYLIYRGPDTRLDDSGMRILWQLTKATFAGVALLGPCWLLFGRRAGIVLLHGGVGLMMFNEFYVSMTNVEAQMTIEEGQTVNFVHDIRTVELAIVDRSGKEEDVVTVVPLSRIMAALESKKPIHDDRLPFDIEVTDYIQNASLRDVTEDDTNPATAGAGLQLFAEPVRPGAGTDSDSKIDNTSAYITLREKKSGESLGTRLVSIETSLQDWPERIAVDGKDYDVYLRFERHYKPFFVTLKDVRKTDYIGTTTPRDYSSDIRLVDKTRNVDTPQKIWMNNPMRFAGETFYQSGFHSYAKTVTDPETGKVVVDPSTGRPAKRVVEATTFSVVTNSGWMIPYVGCMIVVVGLLAHFGFVLMRFLRRDSAGSPVFEDEASEAEQKAATTEPTVKSPLDRSSHRPVHRPAARTLPLEENRAGASAGGLSLSTLLACLAVVLLAAAYVSSKARRPKVKDDQFNLYAAGELPIVEQGRTKPLDTLARNSLKIISGRQDFTGEDGKKHPAIEWLFDVIARPDAARKHKVFRIENHNVLDLLGLTPRSGYRYSVDEFIGKIEEFNEQVRLTEKITPRSRDVLQRKVMELDGRIRTFTLLHSAFAPPPLPELPTREEFAQDPQAAELQVREFGQALRDFQARMQRVHPPLAVPAQLDGDKAGDSDKEWEAYSLAWTTAYVGKVMADKTPPAGVFAWSRILTAWSKQDQKEFNSAVDSYERELSTASIPELSLKKIGDESFFNHFEPFYYAAVLQVMAFLLTVVGWVVRPMSVRAARNINWAAFALIAFTFVVHSWGLYARMSISGRPPVTNLYSSAIFIGWGAVLMGMILEAMFRLGFGNLLASVSGFAALLIAHMLSGDGDTFTVLQAVLDTQFWLATHVTCITLGYASTYVAGILGMIYVLFGLTTRFLAEGRQTSSAGKAAMIGVTSLVSPVAGLAVASSTGSNNVGRDLAKMIYGILCFAIFFSFFGTVLGGLWADDSWGRFWGWDPKENGALIIVLWNALVLHARWGGIVRDRGMAVLAIAGNIVTSWSWFGVNELGVGLHSYGFTEGVLAALLAAVGVHLAWIGAGCLPKEMWRSFQK